VLGQHLKAAGHDVSIIASNVNYHSRSSAEDLSHKYRAKIEDFDGVTFLWLTVPVYQSMIRRVLSMVVFAARAVLGRSTSYLAKPDIIVGSTPHPFAALAAYFLSWRYKTKFILEVRDIWPESLIELGGYAKFNPFILLISAMEKFLLRRADRVITLLPKAGEDLERKGAASDKIAWIPNGVDTALFGQPVAPARTEAFKIIYAGAHGVANGLDVAIDAAKELQAKGDETIRFIFVGDGTQKDVLKRKAESLSLDNVEFRDSVPKQQIPDVLSEANACFMHLRDMPVFRWGVSPNKLFDYMAAARPIIFAVNTSADPVEIAGAGLSIVPENPSALADAALSLSELSDEELEAMGRRGREYVLKHHTEQVLGARFLELLEGLSREGAA